MSRMNLIDCLRLQRRTVEDMRRGKFKEKKHTLNGKKNRKEIGKEIQVRVWAHFQPLCAAKYHILPCVC